MLQRFNPNILKKCMGGSSKSVQYCCVAVGSRDRSLSIWFTSLKRPLLVIHDVFEDSVSLHFPMYFVYVNISVFLKLARAK